MSIIEEDRIRKANEEVESIINAGAPIVKLDIFDTLDRYAPSEQIKEKIEYTFELYMELINKLSEYSEEDQKLFLTSLKESDIIDNQSLEKEDSFMIALYRNFDDLFSVDLLLEKICSSNYFSKEDFIKFHDVLLLGTSSKNKLGLRDNNLKFVGSYQENPQTKYYFENRAISYFPLKYTEIDKAIDKFLNFYNSGIKPNSKYDSILIPIICHGLLASLQLFKDGNTRYGRLFQNVLMYKLINEQLGLNLLLPVVYASRQYAAYRSDYRKKIENIVLNNNQQAWDEWINFNINRIQDGIFYNLNSLEALKEFKRKGK